uniref:Glycolipid transfer protein domain-containing protein n=1 Tax=Rhodosorus marinus TaxID=101924 RepID=A0A7S3A6B6_9RHOD|mmetsp:Transcript_44297/g.172376  ORF Transcript_44297/g.172376 Transcript_44297/m.172376 type:complete len:241 (+) Transcript_44297:111-833(+)
MEADCALAKPTCAEDALWTFVDDRGRAEELPSIVKEVEKESSRANKIIESWFDVATVEDLRGAVDGLVTVVEALLKGAGPAAGIVVGDMTGNLKKIEKSARVNGAETVPEIFEKETDRNAYYRDSGREGLLWLKRTLQFFWKSIHYCIADPEDRNLSRVLKKAYNETLAGCHGFRAHAFRLLMNGAPSKTEFFRRMGGGTLSDEIVVLGLRKWTELSRPVICEYIDFGLLIFEYSLYRST